MKLEKHKNHATALSLNALTTPNMLSASLSLVYLLKINVAFITYLLKRVLQFHPNEEIPAFSLFQVSFISAMGLV